MRAIRATALVLCLLMVATPFLYRAGQEVAYNQSFGTPISTKESDSGYAPTRDKWWGTRAGMTYSDMVAWSYWNGANSNLYISNAICNLSTLNTATIYNGSVNQFTINSDYTLTSTTTWCAESITDNGRVIAGVNIWFDWGDAQNIPWYSNITVNIQTDNANKPSGTLFDAWNATRTVMVKDLPLSMNGYTYRVCYSFMFNDTITLDANKNWIVVQQDWGGTYEYVAICRSTTSTYANGDFAYSTNAGGAWTVSTSQDMAFNILSPGGTDPITLTGQNCTVQSNWALYVVGNATLHLDAGDIVYNPGSGTAAVGTVLSILYGGKFWATGSVGNYAKIIGGQVTRLSSVYVAGTSTKVNATYLWVEGYGASNLCSIGGLYSEGIYCSSYFAGHYSGASVYVVYISQTLTASITEFSNCTFDKYGVGGYIVSTQLGVTNTPLFYMCKFEYENVYASGVFLNGIRAANLYHPWFVNCSVDGNPFASTDVSNQYANGIFGIGYAVDPIVVDSNYNPIQGAIVSVAPQYRWRDSIAMSLGMGFWSQAFLRPYEITSLLSRRYYETPYYLTDSTGRARVNGDTPVLWMPYETYYGTSESHLFYWGGSNTGLRPEYYEWQDDGTDYGCIVTVNVPGYNGGNISVTNPNTNYYPTVVISNGTGGYAVDKVTVWGTEYFPGDAGKVYTQIITTSATGDVSCQNSSWVNVSILNAVGTKESEGRAYYVPNSMGIYCFNYTAPVAGVYVASVNVTITIPTVRGAFGSAEIHVRDSYWNTTQVALVEQIYVLLQRLENTTDDINTTVNTINGVVSGIDTVVRNIDGNLTNINATVLNINGTVNNINGTVVNINGIVTNIDGNVTNINGTVTNINGYVVNLDGNVTNIQGDVTNINGTVVNIEGIVTNINGTVTNINGTVYNVYGTVVSINGTVIQINTTLWELRTHILTFWGEFNATSGNLTGLIDDFNVFWADYNYTADNITSLYANLSLFWDDFNTTMAGWNNTFYAYWDDFNATSTSFSANISAWFNTTWQITQDYETNMTTILYTMFATLNDTVNNTELAVAIAVLWSDINNETTSLLTWMGTYYDDLMEQYSNVNIYVNNSANETEAQSFNVVVKLSATFLFLLFLIFLAIYLRVKLRWKKLRIVVFVIVLLMLYLLFFASFLGLSAGVG